MNYKSDFFQRVAVLNNALLAAGTYKRGQLLGPPSAAGVFSAWSGSGAVGAVCVNDITLAAQGNAAIARGEFGREGIAAVSASLASPVTVGDAAVAACFAAGIILN